MDLESLSLIKELNNEASQMISGGFFGRDVLSDLPVNSKVSPNLTSSKNRLDIYNGTNYSLYFDLSFGNTNSQDIQLQPGKSINFSDFANAADVRFDGDLGKAGVQFNSSSVKAPGKYAFVLDCSGKLLSLV